MSDKAKKKILTILPSLFNSIVGQEAAKKKTEFYLNSYLHTRIFTNAIFTAGKGQGKTTLARKIARGLLAMDDAGEIIMEQKGDKVAPKHKAFIEVNCSTIKNVKQFINSIIIPYVADKEVTIFFDEASEIPNDVSMALLTILNPNPDNRTTFAYEEYVCDFDFRRQTFLFATSEPQKVFHALMDRLERIDLEDYSYSDLAKIVQKGAKEVEFDSAALESIAQVLRGNARQAQMMADKVKQYLRGGKKFSSRQWKDLSTTLGILPLGLNATELRILRHLATTNETISLTGLAAKTGLTREAVQKDYEPYLQRHNLMEIHTAGRSITAKGLEYLKSLDGKPISTHVAVK